MQKAFRRSIITIFVIFFLFLSVNRYYTDWLWFKSVGYDTVYIKIIMTKLILAVIFGAVFFVFIYANILIARAMAPRYMLLDENELGGRLRYQFQLVAQRYRLSIDRYFNILLLAGAIFLSLGSGLSALPMWEGALKYLNRVPFGQTDPVFGRDLGYYVFNLPMLQFLRSWLYSTIIMAILVTAFVHFFDGAIRVRRGAQQFAAHVKAHISVLIGLLFAVIAFDYWLRRAELLYSTRGVVFGASYTDVHAHLPALNILGIIALICAALLLINIQIKGWLLPAAGISILAVASLVIGSLYPAIIQQYRVSPNEIVRETPYIKLNIKHTREAYNLDKIAEKSFAAEEALTAKELAANDETVSNIRLWDWRPLKKTFEQIQGIRLYYTFSDVDVDRYKLNGKLTQVLLSPRELSPAQLPDEAKTWQNEHLVYTHGYGMVMSNVSKVTTDGMPELLIKDVPPTEAAGLKITRPELYFSEIGSDYVFVNTGTKEFDYPQGDTNKYATYTGAGGIKINSLWRKLLFTIRFSSLKILLSDSINDLSRVLYYRHIGERADRVAPFLGFDQDPYLVIRADGRLCWLLDGYTLTDMYPYSQPFDESHNYLRNSVKVAIDAYNGNVDYYISDDTDPLVKAYAKMFPGLFKPFSEMPEDLKAHVRYPVDYFNVQSKMYATYHMQDPQVFYNKEDQWSMANEVIDQQQQTMEPYYIVMELADKEKAELLLMIPFTPKNKNNMIAWMAAQNDIPDYGKLLVYKFPKQKLVYGTMQIEARVDQDPEISQQLSLWNQRGSKVIRGNLLVIPIENSIMYVEPIYLQAEQTELPELKRVVVAYGSQVVMEPTLAEALNRIFTGEAAPKDKKPAASTTQGKTVKGLIDEANAAFNAAVDAQKKGDWAEYGKQLNSLESLLKNLSVLNKK